VLHTEAARSNADLPLSPEFDPCHLTDLYPRVLDACALLPDLEILAGGDETEIGEKVRKKKEKFGWGGGKNPLRSPSL
jgi:hypothetical protein